MKNLIFNVFILEIFIVQCSAMITNLNVQVDQFLELVNAGYKALYRIENEAQWLAVTDVKPEHVAAAETASKAKAAFCGNPAIIIKAKEFLHYKDQLSPLQVRQLERILLNAAEAPMTNPSLAEERIREEARQAALMNSYEFKLNDKVITPNEIDNILNSSTNLTERLAVWNASKEIGKQLKPGLVKLQQLRNRVAQELGYPDYFSLQCAAYGMTADEVLAMQDKFMEELRPLYVQLHTWVKNQLAKRYNQAVPDLIPAHWINNRWAQNWPGLVKSADFDDGFKNKSPEWIVHTAEGFYKSLGFAGLPPSFWEKSDLYPLAAGAARKKNTHASCWHVDLETDIRSLMSVEPNMQWFETTHHELGHAYYFMCYSRPEIPALLRNSASPALHETIAELIALASSQIPYLKSVGVVPSDFNIDPVESLLNEALSSTVPFIFWSSGTMTHWEYDFYVKNMPQSEWNKKWWEYVQKFQGVVPPSDRTEDFCDPATKTHINDNPAYYFSYAIATVLKYQLHEYIASKILNQPIHECSYYGRPEVGNFLHRIMDKGATVDWRELIRETTGQDVSTKAMVKYFEPLYNWLVKQNKNQVSDWR